MLRKRTRVPYWSQFQKYQTFADFDKMKETISLFMEEYVLTKSMKAVLNTIKLHAKNFVGVCWLFREEISKKSGYSLSSVDRAIEAFVQAGLIKVVHWMNDKRGGQSHNIYIVQDLYGLNDQASDEANEQALEEANDEASNTPEHDSNPCGSKADAVAVQSYKNFNKAFHKNSNNNSNTKESFETFEENESVEVQSLKVETEVKADEVVQLHEAQLRDQHQQDFELEKEIALKHVPAEFTTIFNPFYGNKPQIILDRWKSFCVAVKRSSVDMSLIDWNEINDLWKITVNRYKRGLIKNAKYAKTQKDIDDAIGGYFYMTLCDHLPFLMLKQCAFIA